MIVETEITVSAPSDRVWEELSDLEALAAVIPGSQLKPVDGDSILQGTLRPELGGSAIDCIGTLRPLDLDEDSRSATCSFRVRQSNGTGFATGTLRGRVSGSDGSARVALALDGRLAAPGIDETSVRDEADKLLAALASELEKSLAERASRPAKPKARAQVPPTTLPQAEPATGERLPAAPARPGPPQIAIAGIVALGLALLLGRRKRRRRGRFELPW
jgi:LPXTG-motif cell wall-anchored protein